MSENSDEQLIDSYLKGEEKALEILIKRYLKPIYSFSYRFVNNTQEAEDISQEVFVKIWRNLKKFDKNKKFKTWIFSIAKNTCLDAMRKKKTIPFSEFENIAGSSFLPDELYERADLINGFNLAVAKLPLKYRLVEQHYWAEQLTFKEISQILNKPLNTLKSQHRRALIQLKKILKKN
jgi:RNA polymerase sigma-70 factor (ECF subfamily)